MNGPLAVESERAVGRGKLAGRWPFYFFVHVSVDGLVHGLVHGLVDQSSDRNMAKIQPFITNFLIALKFPKTKGSYILLAN